MTVDALRDYCLAKPGVAEDLPFGPYVLCFKVAGKLFALLALDEMPMRVNLKCDPERAIDLRERYAAVEPGYHMNKQHWNTVILDGSVPTDELRDWIDHSYDLVVAKLPKKTQATLNAAA